LPHRFRPRLLATAAALLLSLGLAGPAQVASAQTADPQTDLVAVTGTDKRLWYTWSYRQDWRPLGGVLVDAPSIAVGTDVYFVGLGQDNNVWIRSFSRGWQRLGPVGTHCANPVAEVSVDSLGVACLGRDGAIWFSQVTLRSDGTLPVLTGWRSLGGRLLSGPSLVDVTLDDNVPLFWVSAVGGDNRIWETLSRDPKWSTAYSASHRCGGPVTADYYGGHACRDLSTEGLRIASFGEGGTSVVPGRVKGRIGITSDAHGTARYYALGHDGTLWTAYYDDGGSSAPRFTRFSGAGLGGVAAVRLNDGIG